MPLDRIRRIKAHGWTSSRTACVLGALVLSMVGIAWSAGAFAPENRPQAILKDDGNAVDRPSSAPASGAIVKDRSGHKEPDRSSYPAWPAESLEGDPAKKFLLAMLIKVNESFEKVPSYTATFRKQERLKGSLVPEQTFAMKVRQSPFAIYMKALAPAEGKEIIFARGSFDDKVVAHSSGFSRLLVPRLQVPPEHPLVMAESRHPITNAGIGNLLRRLIGYRKLDLEEAEAETSLDRCTDPEGRSWLRSIHLHHVQTSDRPFTRVEVLYDPDSRLPLRFTGYDWPAGRTGPGEAPILGERYTYDDLALDVPLSPLDFDPANPAYHFHRL